MNTKKSRAPKKKTPEGKSLDARTLRWIPAVVGVATIALGIFTARSVHEGRMDDYRQGVNTVRPTLPMPIMDREKGIDPIVAVKAERELRVLQQSQPDEPEAIELRSSLALQAGDTKAAASLAESALALDPENPTALNILGLIAKDNGNFQVAEAYFNRSASSAHSRRQTIEENVARLNLAIIAVINNSHKEIESLLLDPKEDPATSAMAHKISGISAMQQGQLENAATDFFASAASDQFYCGHLHDLICTIKSQKKNMKAVLGSDWRAKVKDIGCDIDLQNYCSGRPPEEDHSEERSSRSSDLVTGGAIKGPTQLWSLEDGSLQEE